MQMLIPGFLKRTVRPVAGMVLLAFAFVSSAECVLGSMSAEEMACCAEMQADCMAITSSCCAGEVQSYQSLVAAKAANAAAPVPTVVAILNAPAAVTRPPRFDTGEAGSTSPPGVSTYLFVASFRI